MYFSSNRWQVAVHPHAGGENVYHCRPTRRLSVHPHAGGENFNCHHPPSAIHRFTPTRVGKTPLPQAVETHRHGSPPRGWGKPEDVENLLAAERFTPTRVGKT